ncbi:helix-turn-helix domain-containing protein [Microbacterium sp. SS28]|uniref:helix-turn-helix domain-containing protein n=1 Tax=Microbacterium sp. SS28 TaxID=2919948 RepID=UPI001FA98345|nr:helix-turn-helix domain-containing protein [Microbacterium sp. SS28]
MSAPTAAPREATHPHVVRVVAGEFTEGADYTTWRERGTSDWLLIHTVAGAGRVVGPTGTIVSGVGDTVLLRPHAPHDYGTAVDSWSLVFAHFHPRAEWLPLLDWPVEAGGVGRVHAAGEMRPRVLAALRTCARSSTGSLAQSEMFAMNALEAALLWLDTQNPLRGRVDERLLRVMEHVGADLAGDLGVEALARIATLSPSRLTHLFTASLGIPPQRYVERERLTRAAQLLSSTDRAVGEIARDVGWDDPLYFSRRFSHLHGMSPSAYRRRWSTASAAGGARSEEQS